MLPELSPSSGLLSGDVTNERIVSRQPAMVSSVSGLATAALALAGVKGTCLYLLA